MFPKRRFVPVQIYEPIMTRCFLGTDVQANNPMGPFKLLKGKNLMISFFNECFWTIWSHDLLHYSQFNKFWQATHYNMIYMYSLRPSFLSFLYFLICDFLTLEDKIKRSSIIYIKKSQISLILFSPSSL